MDAHADQALASQRLKDSAMETQPKQQGDDRATATVIVELGPECIPILRRYQGFDDRSQLQPHTESQTATNLIKIADCLLRLMTQISLDDVERQLVAKQFRRCCLMPQHNKGDGVRNA